MLEGDAQVGTVELKGLDWEVLGKDIRHASLARHFVKKECHLMDNKVPDGHVSILGLNFSHICTGSLSISEPALYSIDTYFSVTEILEIIKGFVISNVWAN